MPIRLIFQPGPPLITSKQAFYINRPYIFIFMLKLFLLSFLYYSLSRRDSKQKYYATNKSRSSRTEKQGVYFLVCPFDIDIFNMMPQINARHSLKYLFRYRDKQLFLAFGSHWKQKIVNAGQYKYHIYLRALFGF